MLHDTTPPEKVSTASDIGAALKARIFSGALRPGARLIETDLAEEFDVGRSRVREAFRILVGEGHLEQVANRGVLVRRYSRQELLDMGRAREVLESLAARLAAERSLTEAERADLSAVQTRMNEAEAAGDLDAFSRENRTYHTLIETIASNRHVAELIERVRIPYLGLRLPRIFSADQMRQSNEGHRFITYAILAGVPEVAEAAMRSHIQAGNAHTASLPDEVFD